MIFLLYDNVGPYASLVLWPRRILPPEELLLLKIRCKFANVSCPRRNFILIDRGGGFALFVGKPVTSPNILGSKFGFT